MDYLIKLRLKNHANWCLVNSKSIKFDVSIGLEVFSINPGDEIVNFFEALSETENLEFLDENVVQAVNWTIEPGDAIQKEQTFKLNSKSEHEFEFLPKCCFMEDGTKSSESMLECSKRNVNQVYRKT